MRIAQLAPLAESGPPKLCAETERVVVSWLSDQRIATTHHGLPGAPRATTFPMQRHGKPPAVNLLQAGARGDW
jgi:hypothetical protein